MRGADPNASHIDHMKQRVIAWVIKSVKKQHRSALAINRLDFVFDARTYSRITLQRLGQRQRSVVKIR